MGDPKNHDTVIGPLIEEKQCEFIDRQVRDAVDKGARLLTGGKHQGPYYEPTVLADVARTWRIFDEESFGPVTLRDPGQGRGGGPGHLQQHALRPVLGAADL